MGISGLRNIFRYKSALLLLPIVLVIMICLISNFNIFNDSFPSPNRLNFIANREELSSKQKIINSFKNIYYYLINDIKDTKLFKNSKTVYTDLLDRFSKVARTLNLPWMLYGESLLESWFHHGIYFHESLEILMDIRDKPKIENGLKRLIKLHPEYIWGNTISGIEFLRKVNLDKNGNKMTKIHFLDVKFFTYNASHTWEISTKKSFPSKFFFPIITRPFEKRLVFAPKDTFEVLFAYFGPDFEVCERKGEVSKNKRHCRWYSQSVPLVHRSKSVKGGVMETLKIGKKTLRTWWGRDLPQNGLNHPFSLRKPYALKKQEFSEYLNGIPNFNQKNKYDGMTPKDKIIGLKILEKLIEIMDSLGAPWFINCGTMLGSWRHHGVIPWDDDLDVVLHSKYRRPLMKAIKKLYNDTNGAYDVAEMGVSKFWSPKTSWSKSKGVRWKWPYIDIFFYVNDSIHLWHEEKAFSDKIYNVKDIFPLRKRPFEGRLLNTPYDTFAFLGTNFGRNGDCWAAAHSHKREDGSKLYISTSCKKMSTSVAFVHRRNSPFGGVIEELKFGDTVFNTWWGRDEPQYPAYNAFSLKTPKIRKKSSAKLSTDVIIPLVDLHYEAVTEKLPNRTSNHSKRL